MTPRGSARGKVQKGDVIVGVDGRRDATRTSAASLPTSTGRSARRRPSSSRSSATGESAR